MKKNYCTSIAVLLSAALNVPASAAVLAHWWALDGAADTSATVGGSTYTGLNAAGAAAPTSAQNRFGEADTAMQFTNGGLEYTMPVGQRLLNYPSHSVSAWVLADDDGGGGGYDRIMEGRFNVDFFLGANGADASGNQRYLFIAREGGPFPNSPTAGSIDNTQWQLVTGTYDNGTGIARLYVNGLLVDSGLGTAPANVVEFTIGSNDHNLLENWEGRIDDASVWDGALTGTEVRALHSLSVSGNTRYTPDNFEDMLTLFAAENSGTVGNINWTYSDNLTGTPGVLEIGTEQSQILFSSNAGFYTMDIFNAIPEPSSALLILVGAALLNRLRNARARDIR